MPIAFRTSLLSLAVTVALAVRPATGQVRSSAETADPRQWTVAGGLGNSVGWFGAQAERHDRQNRLSAFVGVGYTPAISAGEPSGLTLAAGGRAFTAGERHRGFLELALSQLAIQRRVGGNRYYGPALQMGYQYTARGGFTLFASGGVGYIVGGAEAVVSSRWKPVVGAGAGYTWR